MGAFVSVSPERISVEPGSSVGLTVTVRNTGQQVDQFAIDILGEAAAFAVVEPETLSLFPGAEGNAIVRFEPPRLSTMSSGEIRVGIRVVPRVDSAGRTVEEATLVVAAFGGLFASLRPKTSTGRRSGGQDLVLENRGNVPAEARIEARDEELALTCEVSPSDATIPAGATSISKLRVKPRSIRWRGQDVSRRFRISVAAGGERLDLDTVYVQRPIVPGFLGTVVAAAPAFVLAAAAVSALVLQPWNGHSSTPTQMAFQSASPSALQSLYTSDPTDSQSLGPTDSPVPPTPSPTPAVDSAPPAEESTPPPTPPPTPTPTPIPPLVPTGSGAGTVSARLYSSCAIKQGGTVACWGSPSFSPTGHFLSISSYPRSSVTCGLTTDLAVVCWSDKLTQGGPAYGATLGPGNRWAAVASGNAYGCALRSDGTFQCWGTTDGSTPTGGPYRAISIGDKQSCAIRPDQRLVCWCDQSNVNCPALAAPDIKVKAVRAGWMHNCAIKLDDSLECWGVDNSQVVSKTPSGTFIDVAVGQSFSCAIRKTDKTIVCWGWNYYGQAPPTAPVGVFTQVSAGDVHACATHPDGTMVCWGASGSPARITPPANPPVIQWLTGVP